MNKNYMLWIVVVIIIVVGFMLSMNGSTSTYTTAPGTTDTSNSGNSSAGSSAKPVVVTIGFASVSSTTAMFVGTVVPEGAPTTYWFEYGPTPALGLMLNNVVVGTGYDRLGAAGYISGLKPATTYYFRLGAKNANGTVYGAPYSFITAAK